MNSNFCLSETIKEKLSQAELDCKSNERLVPLNCELVDTWQYRDRRQFELGDLAALAHSIKTMGQSQPIVAVKTSAEFRPLHNPHAHYVVIAGYRRWLACKMQGIPVQAIVKSMSFDEAVACLVSENEKEDVSDFSLGSFYHNLLQSERITQEKLSGRLGMSASKLNQYLAFSQIPIEFWNKVGNLSMVKVASAAKIRKYWHMDEAYQKGLIKIAHMIGKSTDKKWEDELLFVVHGKRIEKPVAEVKQLTVNDKPVMIIKSNTFKIDKRIVKHKAFPELQKKIEALMMEFAEKNLN